MTDKEIADQVRAKAGELNSALMAAASAGLSVRIGTEDVTRMGALVREEIVTVEVSRVERI